MNWDFDWLANWRVSLNMLVNVALGALAGAVVAYYTSPTSAEFFSRSVMGAGVVPAVVTFIAKMQKTPSELHTADLTRQIQQGEIPGRRARDSSTGPTTTP